MSRVNGKVSEKGRKALENGTDKCLIFTWKSDFLKSLKGFENDTEKVSYHHLEKWV